MIIYTIDTFPWDKLSNCKIAKRKKGNQSGSGKYNYLNVISAFDIETTKIDDIRQAIMYIWQWNFMGIGVMIGRTWEEYIKATEKLNNILRSKDMDKKKTILCCYVHNLSYEFSFLQGIFSFNNENVYALKSRKVLKAVLDDVIEYRCSYIQTNMSLDLFCETMHVDHLKLHDFDYNKKRFPWTELTKREIEYCVNDVIGLCEAISKEMKRDGDSLYTIPLTSTGYVRRDIKKEMKKLPHTYIKNMQPSFKIFKQLQQAFRGGNTHANRYFAKKTLTNVKSFDRSSSYPDVIVNCKFPIGDWTTPKSRPLNEDYLSELINVRHKAVLFTVQFWNIELNNPYWGCPYISKSKCIQDIDSIYDNGRILSSSFCSMTITDIDFIIILKEYKWEHIKITDLSYCSYQYLPKLIRNKVNEYYILKTTLKGAKTDDEEMLYMLSKAKLNSIYGMMATNPVRETFLFQTINEDGELERWVLDDSISEEELYNKAIKKSFLLYQWGVWTTAWARLRLEQGIEIVGDNFVYADTDSVKYIDDENISWNKFNHNRIRDSVTNNAYATDNKGNTHYMGVFEFDGSYSRFKTYGAKKYAYEDVQGNLHVTISGVNKHLGAEELKTIDNMVEGFIFSKGGGLQAVYNDFPEITEYQVENHTIPITSNIYLEESTYTLGLTGDYERLLNNLGEWFINNFNYAIDKY